MKKLSKQQKLTAAAEETASWIDEVQCLLAFPGPMRTLWPAMVSHNKLLLDGGDFPAAREHREGCLFALAYVTELEHDVALQQQGVN